MPHFADRMKTLGTENAFKIGPYIQRLEEAGPPVIRCNLGEPDFPLPVHIREEVKRALDLDLTHYCDPQGILPLREAIAKDVSAKRGLRVTSDRVVVFPGAKPPIGFCQLAYCNPGDEVIYPSPGFPIYESFVRFLGAKPVPLHLKEEQNFNFTGQELSALITPRTKMIFLNFPSNPTGSVASREQLKDIAEIIKKKAPTDVRIFSDEIYENILFDGLDHQSIASLPGMESMTVIVSGASKSYSWTGGRIGWAVFPTSEEAGTFVQLNINFYSCVPAYNQMGAKIALESPLSKAFVKEMVEAFSNRRDVVVKGLNDIPGIACTMPRGAFYVFPSIEGICRDLGVLHAFEQLPESARSKTSPSTIFQMFLLFKYRVATMDRPSFGSIGSEGEHFLRLSIATGMEDLNEALARIRKASTDQAGFEAFIRDGWNRNPLW